VCGKAGKVNIITMRKTRRSAAPLSRSHNYERFQCVDLPSITRIFHIHTCTRPQSAISCPQFIGVFTRALRRSDFPPVVRSRRSVRLAAVYGHQVAGPCRPTRAASALTTASNTSISVSLQFVLNLETALIVASSVEKMTSFFRDNADWFSTFYSASALLAMQTAVIARAILSVRPSIRSCGFRHQVGKSF